MRIIGCFLILLLLSCSGSKEESLCAPLIFDGERFHEEGHFGIDLLDFSLDDNCLTVKLGFSGCSDDHTFELISQGVETINEPYQMFCDFYDHNPENCEAYFTTEKCYDIQPIRDRYKGLIRVWFRDNEGYFEIK